jgi:hypothetical protein
MMTYIQITGIVRFKCHDRLSPEIDLGAVLRPEPQHHLDAVRGPTKPISLALTDSCAMELSILIRTP